MMHQTLPQTGERPYVCPFQGCASSFKTNGQLKSHILVHTKDKPYKCSVCGKDYGRLARLRIHERKHTGERPYVCPYPECRKTFTERGNLKTHIRSHTGERPFQCPYPDCDKTFITIGHRQDHIRRHLNERLYKCERCEKEYLHSTNLSLHLPKHLDGDAGKEDEEKKTEKVRSLRQ